MSLLKSNDIWLQIQLAVITITSEDLKGIIR